MLKTEFPGVEHLSREKFGKSAAVDFVAHDRVAEMLKMNADLVCPTAVQSAFEQTQFPRR